MYVKILEQFLRCRGWASWRPSVGKLIADTDENIDTTTCQVVEVIDKLSGGQHGWPSGNLSKIFPKIDKASFFFLLF